MLLVLRGGRAALGRQLRRARPARAVSVAALELWNRADVAGRASRAATGASLGAVRRYTHNPLPSPSHMSVADLLEVSKQFRSKQTNYIFETQSLGEAVLSLAKNENSATLVVVNKKQQVVGMLTNHLALERIVKLRKQSRVADWDIKVTEVMIPARELLHVSPDDSLEDCRAVMALSGRSELPVLQGGKLLGTVSLTDIASLIHRHDAQLNPSPTSAKSDYINLILPRKGLPVNTSLDEKIVRNKSAALTEWTYYLHSFAMSIPHPSKKDTGGEDAFYVGTLMNEDGEGPTTPTTDPSTTTTEDLANLTVAAAKEPTDGTVGPVDVLSMGVADGVGSWFEKGVSAREYSHELMKAAHQAMQVAYAKEHRIDPGEVLHAAWSTVLQKEIVGSSTACVMALDPQTGELHAINLGDSGFLIIRDKKSDRETARMRGTLDGSLHRKILDRDVDLTPAGRRKGAHVSYRSPQQLHYFNCPYQLGFAGPDLRQDVVKDLDANAHHTPMNEKPLFETPANAVRLRVPVMEGDLIVLATDGLFDNVDEEDLLEIVRAESEVEQLTRRLVHKAYELSLDRMRDSPFARLAKENDLMWGGGMPDDITIIVSRVRKHKVLADVADRRGVDAALAASL